MYCASCEVRTEFTYAMQKKVDSLCGLVVRIPGCRSRGPVSIPHATSFVTTIEELLGRNGSGSCLENRIYGRRDSSRRPRGIFHPQKLALTSTSGGRSVGIVRLRTKRKEYCIVLYTILLFFYLFIFHKSKYRQHHRIWRSLGRYSSLAD
jgi:hypothetical protein